MNLNQINILAKQIVNDIVEDLSDRRGLRQEWDAIDEDVQEEIKEEWIAMIKKRIPVRIEKKDGNSSEKKP